MTVSSPPYALLHRSRPLSRRLWRRGAAHAARPLCLAVAGLLMACAGSPDAAASAIARSGDGVPVTTTTVVAAPMAMTLRATGTVVARPGSIAAVSAPAPSRITRVFVEPGSVVTRGALLVALDTTSFRAALHEAEAAQQAASLASERASRLAAQGIVPRRDVEQGRATLAQTEAALVVARRNASRATLRAPIAGVVARLTAVLDATADPALPLVEIVDPTATEVRALVAPEAAAGLQRNAPVSLTDAEGAPLGTATVITIAPTVDSISGAVEVRARVTATTRVVRVGESVTVTIRQDAPLVRALQVPPSALVPDADGYRVFVVTAGDTARARPVAIGRRTERAVEIRSGVRAGEIVVVDGAYGLDDGVHVRRRAVPDDSARVPSPARP